MTIKLLLDLLKGLPLNTDIFFIAPGALDVYLSFQSLDIQQSVDDEEVTRDVIFRFSKVEDAEG